MLIEYVRNVVPTGRGIRQISAKAGNALSIEKNKLFLSRAVNLVIGRDIISIIKIGNLFPKVTFCEFPVLL